MAYFFLPSAFQKRLLRYALSRLEIFDTDALNLENLDIAWGKRSTVELRDVGLRLKKITSLLHLPHSLELLRAKVILVRITVPSDIYTSSILIEIEGVDVQARLLTSTASEPSTSPETSVHGDEDEKASHQRGTRPPSRQSTIYDPGGAEGSDSDEDSTEADLLPTTANLAESFLQTEPPAERARLEAAIVSQSRDRRASRVDDEGDDEDSLAGTGTGLSLPGFLTGFLKGISDRLQITMKAIELNMETNLQPDASDVDRVASKSEVVTIQLRVDDITVGKVTADSVGIPAATDETITYDGPASVKPTTHEYSKVGVVGTRRMDLRSIRLSLLSDPSVFASFSRSSSPPSPSTVQRSMSSVFPNARTEEETQFPSRNQSPTKSSKEAVSALPTHSASPHPSPQSSDNEHPKCLEASGMAAEDEKFTDAPDSGDDEAVYASSSLAAGSEQATSSAADNAPFLGRFRKPSALEVEEHGAKDLTYQLGRDGVNESKEASPLPIDDGKEVQESLFHARSGGISLPEGEDLTESKIFSHEEAHSMYMSALSRRSSSESRDTMYSEIRKGLDTEPVVSEVKGEADVLLQSQIASRDASSRHSSSVNPSLRYSSQPEVSQEATGQPSPLPGNDYITTEVDHGVSEEKTGLDMSPSNSQQLGHLLKQIFHVDEVAIWIPVSGTLDEQAANERPGQRWQTSETEDPKTSDPEEINSSTYPAVPGAFFSPTAPGHQREYSNRSTELSKIRPAIRLPPPPHRQSEKEKSERNPVVRDSASSVKVSIGNCLAQVDPPLGKLIIALTQSIKGKLGDGSQSQQPSPKSSRDHSVSDLRVKFRAISLELLESLTGTSLAFKPSSSPLTATLNTSDHYQPADSDVLLRATLKDLEMGRRRIQPVGTETTLSAAKVVLGYAKDSIVSFDAGLRMRESVKDIRAAADKDISVFIRQGPSYSKASVVTLPIHFDLDLLRLDETLAWFGGFSSILGLGSSMASLATVTAPSSPPASLGHKRVVHFETPYDVSRPIASSPAKNKVDIRMGGIIVDLHGKECNVHLDTTAVKIVCRQEGVGAQVDKIKLSGPNSRDGLSAAGVVVDIENLRMEYVLFPKEVDLSRLLCLLGPSDNKYDVEDDILIDTLLRQRKQGPVLRVTLERLAGRSEGLAYLSQLSSLSEEIAKLSTVTKYLPDDNRAGVLTLGLIRDINLETHTNADLGRFSLQSQNMEIAHVSLPLLVAISIVSVRLYRNSVEELLGEVASLGPSQIKATHPMIMARMVGDEMEPTVKIKLRSVRFEYRVPVITELSKSVSSEEVMRDPTRSDPGLGEEQSSQQTITNRRIGNHSDNKQTVNFKYAKLDVVFQDCVLGLNPMDVPCKGLVVLSHMELCGGISSNDLLKLTLGIERSSLLIVDDTDRIAPAAFDVSQPGEETRRSEGSLVPDLCTIGYVSVAYISSARITMQEQALMPDGRKSLDLELNDNLLVLESCADSTQTLQSLFNGLMPPRPPSQEHKYRTEVVTVQDMLASLSGDAFGPVDLRGDFENLPMILEEDPAPDSLPDDVYQSVSYEDSTEFGSPSHSLLVEGVMREHADDIEEASPGTEDSILLESLSTENQRMEGESLQFQEDYFGMTSKTDATAYKWDSVRNRYDMAADVSGSPLRIRIRNVHIIWNLFDGYDWPKTRDAISQAVDDVTSRVKQRQARSEPSAAQEGDESVIGDFLFNSIYIGIPANRNPKELASEINRDVDDLSSETESETLSNTTSPSQPVQQAKTKSKRLRLGRSKHHKMAIELKGITMDLIVFPRGSGETQSSIDVRVRDFEILDHVPTSTWRKFATYMHDAGIRESNANMVHLEILNVQPIPELAASEIVLKVTLLPLRLHVDQDALDFLTRFFEFKDERSTATRSTSDVPFLQRVEVNSVRVKLDYKPKKIDYAGLRSGHTTEFMNLFVLDQADMVLRHVIIYGVAGLDKLSRTLNDIWMPDIKRTQLPGVLAGLAPVRSLVNVGGGVRDLVVVPLKEYRKDGRIVRGIQKGALAFAKTTTSELVKLGAKVAIRTQTALQGAEDFLNRPSSGANAGWEDAALDEEEKRAISLYADQPVGVMQGLRGAYSSLERDLLTARDAIVAMPGEILESGSAQGVAKVVLQRAPTIVFRPAIGATKAISQTLMGATNALDPDHRRRIDEKYKSH